MRPEVDPSRARNGAPGVATGGDASGVVVLVETRYLAQRQPADLVASLRARGVDPVVVDPGVAKAPPLDHAQLAVTRGRSPAVLEVLEGLERRGVAVVNPSRAIRAVLDKARMGATLAAAGVPTPRTTSLAADALVPALRAGPFPVVVKPVAGDNARNVTLVPDQAALEMLRWDEPFALAQPFVPGDGLDLKLYVAGDVVWAVRKASPLLDSAWRSAPPRMARLDDALRDLAHHCGRLFGLELYGVDCILSARGPIVIEVNDFPNYSGIPDAGDRLADHVMRRVRREAAP
jgi:ribosomal protein S6--L-glutamate ligase